MALSRHGRGRFLGLWVLCAACYLMLAAFGPMGLLATGVWPEVNQHLLQVRAWVGFDIVVPGAAGEAERVIEVAPRLDVTPYFQNRVVADPREDALLANLALCLPGDSPSERPRPMRYLAMDDPAARAQLERITCHVGSPLGPSFLLLPLFLVLGGAVATQWVGPVLGGLAVAAVDGLLPWWFSATGEGESLQRSERDTLAVLAGFGTLWLWLAPRGEMWMFAQTTATAGLAVALWLASRRSWIWSGLAFALAVTSRPSTLLALPLILLVAAVSENTNGMPHGRRIVLNGPRLRSLALLLAAPVVLGGAVLTLNTLRFGSPADFGYRFMLTPPELRERLQEHGALSLAHLPRNVRFLLLEPPRLVRDERTGAVRRPWLASDPAGMGVLFVTPAFVAVLLTLRRRRPGGLLVAATWGGLVLVSIPALLYFNTGWVQWGGRFLLDSWPMWLMLCALGLRSLSGRVRITLVALSVVSNGWAALVTALRWWP